MEIGYPTKRTETEIQASLWQALRAEGLDPRLEVMLSIPYKENKQGKQKRAVRKVRLDMVVFCNRKAICIVECKSWDKRPNLEGIHQFIETSHQIQGYNDVGYPVLVCGRLENIPKVVQLILYISKGWVPKGKWLHF